jgi:2-polyprenyl-3-methyl-5-hydroxy-6-metoxy-1,4-benzoquinol methylase
LQIYLVQESCFWFEEITNKVPLNISTEIWKNPDKSRLEGSKMDTFEIKDEEINVEEIMEKIRGNIRKRKESGVYKNENSEEIEQIYSEISCSREKTPQGSGTINSNYDIRNNSYSISSHRPIMGKFLVKSRKLVHGEVRRYVDPVFQKQSELNSNLAGILTDAKEKVNFCSNEMEQLKTEIEKLECENKTLKYKIEQLSGETKQLKIESEQLKADIVSNVKKEVESVISSVNLDLDNKAWLSRILESRIQKGCENQVTDLSGTADSDINYYVFEERFRGSRENILQHQTNFIGYFANCTNVLDIGCGRGEFLELAKDKGINARGIDVDEDMINYCKSKGLDVELKGAIEALEEIKDKSLDGIFISQVVEHLSPDYLISMLNLCNRKMKYGFYIIIETVNPLSLFSFANFYIDLSHVKPVHPETLKFLVNTAGFRDIETKFLSSVPSEMKLQNLPDLNDLNEKSRQMIEICNQNINMVNNALYGAQDYAVIGKK